MHLLKWHVTIIDIKMKLFIRLGPKANFTSYISQISSLSEICAPNSTQKKPSNLHSPNS
jgi:hypothetical protein